MFRLELTTSMQQTQRLGVSAARAALALSLVSVTTPASAQSDEISAYVRAQMDWRMIPALSFAVIKAGRIIRAEAHGLANRNSGDSASVATVFHVGSVGKQFTAAAIMLLVQDGRLSLNDPVTRHIVDAPAAWRGISIRHLLTHTSGLGNYVSVLPDLNREYSASEFIALIAGQPLEFPPGTSFRYSNSGYLLLGLVVEAVSGEHLGDFLVERVFKPLGMTSTGMAGRAGGTITGLANGYRLSEGVLASAPPVSRSLNSTGDGSLYSTLHDMARWDAALYGDAVLNASSRAAMWSPVRLNNGTLRQYGFGWGLGRHGGKRIVEHGGLWQGFSSHIVRYVDDSITVVVLMNLTGIGNTSGLVANRIARAYIPALRSAAWPARTMVVVDTATLDNYAGEFQLDNSTIRVRREGMHLTVSGTGRGIARMIPVSKTEFVIESGDGLRFRFTPRQGRKADLYVVEGSTKLAKRITN